jgi:alpha-1,2-mannosyltransferase
MTAHRQDGSALPPFERQWLVYGGFALSAVLFLAMYRPWNLTTWFMVGAPVGRDFTNFWTGGHLALHGRLDLLVDLHGYNDFINGLFHHGPNDERVFSYPPHFLLFFVPFALLPLTPAALLWTAMNVWLIERAVRLLTPDWRLRLAACLAPAVTTMVAFGHFGGVIAFVAIFALRSGKERPLLAGLCLALMTIKPQLAVSFGALLLLAGYWRAILWSIPATLLILGASVAAFGVKPWINFFEWTVPFHAMILSVYVHEVLRAVVSLYSAARLLGLSASVGYWVQTLYGIAVVIGAAALLRYRGVTPRTVTLALFAMLASLPYFANYDLAIMVPALTVALFSQQPGESSPFLGLVPASVLWTASLFSAALDSVSLPIISLALAGILVLGLGREAMSLRRGRGGAPVLAASGATGH